MLLKKIFFTSTFVLGVLFAINYTKREKKYLKNIIENSDKTTSTTNLNNKSNTASQTNVSFNKNENYFIKESITDSNDKWYDIVYN